MNTYKHVNRIELTQVQASTFQDAPVRHNALLHERFPDSEFPTQSIPTQWWAYVPGECCQIRCEVQISADNLPF